MTEHFHNTICVRAAAAVDKSDVYNAKKIILYGRMKGELQ